MSIQYTPGCTDDPIVDAHTEENEPYRGLRAFSREDSRFFFGRDEVTRTLARRVVEQRSTLVVGPSGSGKSSLIFAGLIPALEKHGELSIARMRPGSDPVYGLVSSLVRSYRPEEPADDVQSITDAVKRGDFSVENIALRALQSGDGRSTFLLLIIDQFEELYFQCRDRELQAKFLEQIEALLELDTTEFDIQPRIVISLRADCIGNLLADPRVPPALYTGDVKIPPLTRDELRAAIQQPCSQVGAEPEPGLTEVIIADVEEASASLPLVQFLMSQLWLRRTGGWLTHQAYRETGGVREALASFAEDRFVSLPGDQQASSRRLFLNLVHSTSDGLDLRRTMPRSALNNVDDTVVEYFVQSRLITADWDEHAGQEIVEIVHEAIIGTWPKLRSWLDDQREFRIWQGWFGDLVQRWSDARKPQMFLMEGTPLQEAERWAGLYHDEFNPEQLDFLSQCKKNGHMLNTLRAIGGIGAVAAIFFDLRALLLYHESTGNNIALLCLLAFLLVSLIRWLGPSWKSILTSITQPIATIRRARDFVQSFVQSHEYSIRPSLFGLVLICFSLPFVTISCGQHASTYTGYQLARGIEKGELNPLMIAAIQCAIVGLVAALVGARGRDEQQVGTNENSSPNRGPRAKSRLPAFVQTNRADLVTGLASLTGILCLLTSSIAIALRSLFGAVEYRYGYHLSLLLFSLSLSQSLSRLGIRRFFAAVGNRMTRLFLRFRNKPTLQIISKHRSKLDGSSELESEGSNEATTRQD